MTKKLIVLVIVVVVIAVAAAVFFVGKKGNPQESGEDQFSVPTELSAGQILSGSQCEGEGSKELTHLPMDESDFAFIEPYGLMIDAHVTPIDHWYFSPTVWTSPRDAYPVYAIADGVITEIQHRIQGLDGQESNDEYRLVVTYSCTFFSYYDLVTSLSPDVEGEFTRAAGGTNYASVHIPVTAGQEIGRIGGQTLDFAVWDTEKPLTGFVVPDHYTSEPWKLYTANPYDYFTPEIKHIFQEKNLRVVEPVQGQIDYDVDGRLVGTWFLDGTSGYGGANERTNENYWNGHLSIVYHHLDPDAIIISIGDFQGEPEQFAVANNVPDPKDVSLEDGLVKYELTGFDFLTADDQHWDRFSVSPGLQVINTSETFGTMLVQMVHDREIKMEVFPGQAAVGVTDFTSEARIYKR